MWRGVYAEMTELKLDWCSYEAAKYAVEHWHYSRRMPKSKLNTVGVWEDGNFIGAVIFGYGATPNIYKPYNLTQQDVCELVRVALTNHINQVSRIAAIALKMLKKKNPQLRLIVSYADKDMNHDGGIYKAGGWIYTGLMNDGNRSAFIIKGEKVHPRTIGSAGGVQSLSWVRANMDAGATEFVTQGKHKYLFPLDSAMRQQIEPLRKPYPKRDRGETDNAPQSNEETGGASPTRSLSLPIRRLDATG
jgi:hypothetical protein